MKRINELFDVQEDFKVYSIHSDSRYVKKNSIFFCIDGLSVDGHKYIQDALFLGAKAIVYSKPLTYKKQGVLYIKVNDVLDELNRVAHIFYDSPSEKMKMIGVTGSSGKTTVSLMLKDILSSSLNMGFIGTNIVQYGNITEQCPYTTPESIFLHRHLRKMVNHNVECTALEVSSHGLALKRVNGVRFDIGVFTNVFDEHIDFHGTIEHIMLTKAKMFSLIKEDGYAILNADEVRFLNTVYDHMKCNILTYGIEHKADIMAKNIHYFIDHSEFDLFIFNENFHINLPVISKMNVLNILTVTATLVAMGYSGIDIYRMLLNVKNIEGRLEYLKHDYDFHVIVDYCHSLNSVENILKFAKSVKKPNSRIIAVIGPLSKKSTKKRGLLGKLMNTYCDQVILSEVDNKDDILESCLDIQKNIDDAVSVIIEDRYFAIEQAIEIATKDDIILLLGKGNENFMNTDLGTVAYFGDKNIAYSTIDRIFKYHQDDVFE